MTKSVACYFWIPICLTFFQCSKGKSEDALALVFLGSPAITSVEPKIGTPRQNNENGVYPPTQIVIKGSNFGVDTVIRFNQLPAAISANLGTELYTSVPDGATSGFLTISKSGGSCLPGTASGINCAGTEFFIDCYSVTGNLYGSEIEIKQGESQSIEFKGLQTKAFRSSLILGNAKLTVTCDSNVTVRLFSTSCLATDYISKKDPSIPLNANANNQFYVTAFDDTCTVSI
ncbi:hypothetical protein LPTSP4_30680 [Leptospira ryugenii]|uniref:IPT/TIG domain protein n=1 Tax=Leptospira ryugenii TaxID=1917863 RepID=A0A2P2E3Q9_9LEPT|nr:hypothetical protein [Leptospira ryugenii]GBF51530.1 hypothetical protein LPTSP4_30680 [Leptospira ryugenii]